MKKLITILLLGSAGLLAGFLIDRFALNPRPLSSMAMAMLALLAVSTAITAASFLGLRTRMAPAVINAWLVGISTLIAYVIVDVVAGALLIQPLSPAQVRDDYVHHRLEPDAISRIQTTEYAYFQHVNAFGLRGPPIEAEKPEGVYRILMLGDSFTMGIGVADAETFSALLDRRLNERTEYHAGPRIEILNAGVSSYTPLLSRIQLTRLAPLISPDLVVLNLDMSDLIQEQAYRSLAVRDSSGRIVAVPGPDDYDFGKRRWAMRFREDFINNHLLLTRWFLTEVDAWAADPNSPTVTNTVLVGSSELLRHTLASDTTDRERQWADLFESIGEIARYCEERGIGFLLTTYPWGHQVSDQEWTEGRERFIPDNAVVSDVSRGRIERFAQSHGLEFLDMFPIFRARTGAEPLYFELDMHWTPAGHRVAAEALEPVLWELIGRDGDEHATAGHEEY